MDFFSQETYDFQIFRNDSLIIASYHYTKISIFHQLALRLWLIKMMIYAQIILNIHPKSFIQKSEHSKNSAFCVPQFCIKLINAAFFTFCDQR